MSEPADSVAETGEPVADFDRLESISHYRLLEVLGRGAQGVVYLAEDTNLHRKVALKMLSGAGAQSTVMRQRLMREAEITSKLEHPGICGIHDVGEEHGIPFIAMQFVRGMTLESIIAEAKEADAGGDGERAAKKAGESSGSSVAVGAAGGSQDVVRLIEHAARALHVAHEAGLVHRDIKPGNIMVTQDGDPVLLDFGLGRDLQAEDQGLTQSGQIIGTPAYLAPEQILAERDGVDRRTDVYALGVTLYECLTLRRPFETESWDQLFHSILNDDAPNPKKFNPRIPPDLRTIAEVAMDRDPHRRYATALEFAEDLRRMRNFEPIQAKPAGLALRARKWVRRHQAAAMGIAVTVLFLVAGATFLVNQRLERERSVRENLARAEAALSSSDFAGALGALAIVLEHAPDHPRAGALRLEVDRAQEAAERAARREQDLAGAAAARDESVAARTAHEQAIARIDVLRRELEREQPEVFATFAPAEERGRFARKELELERAEVDAERLLIEAEESLQRAARLESAWGGPTEATEAAFATFYLERWRRALAAGDGVATTWLRERVLAHDRAGRHTAELEGLGSFQLAVHPPEAELWLFRYESIEAVQPGDPVPRLVPVPVTGSAAADVVAAAHDVPPGTPCVVVEDVAPESPAATADLRAGDLVVALNGQPCGDGLFVTGAGAAALGVDAVAPLTRIATLNGRAVGSRFDWLGIPATGATDRIGLAGHAEELDVDRARVECRTPLELLDGGADAPFRSSSRSRRTSRPAFADGAAPTRWRVPTGTA
jgi:tRNA A-37 threonylcarbamoyl transferase component Bud32